jgi:hypothetical protein
MTDTTNSKNKKLIPTSLQSVHQTGSVGASRYQSPQGLDSMACPVSFHYLDMKENLNFEKPENLSAEKQNLTYCWWIFAEME